MNTLFDDYQMELTMTARLPMTGEELEHINPIEGTIYFFNKSFNREVCGKLQCYFVNIEKMLSDGENFLLYLDDHSRELSETIVLYNSQWNYKTGHLNSAAHKALSLNTEIVFSEYDNFVLIDRLEITQKHRGKGVGIYFLREALTYLSEVLHTDFYVMKPFPLQNENNGRGTMVTNKKWHSRLGLDKLEKNHAKALKKLCSLYAGLGFNKVRGTKFMVCPSIYFSE